MLLSFLNFGGFLLLRLQDRESSTSYNFSVIMSCGCIDGALGVQSAIFAGLWPSCDDSGSSVRSRTE